MNSAVLETSAEVKKVPLQIFKIDQRVETPFYASAGSAGFDLRAFIPDEKITLKARARTIVPTGLKVIIPEGFEIQIRPRSGLAFKAGISLTNTPGTIDSDYRGELKVLMVNHSDEDFEINNGDRIAQAIIAPVFIADFKEISEMPNEENNERGSGGFGSTGTK